MVDDNVTGFARRLGPDDALRANNLAGEGGLILVNVHGHGRLIPVGTRLQEVLRRRASSRRRRRRRELEHRGTGGDDAGARREETLGVIDGLNDLDDLHGLLGREGRRGQASGGECDGG